MYVCIYLSLVTKLLALGSIQHLLNLVVFICLKVHVVKSSLSQPQILACDLVFIFLSESCFLSWQDSSHRSRAKSLHDIQKILWSPLTCDVMHFLLSYTLYFLAKRGQLNLGLISSMHELHVLW